MAEKLIAREQSARMPLTPRQMTAVVRMFASTMGWHLLTERCGLSTDEAAGPGAVTQMLLDAPSAGAPPGAPSSRPLLLRREASMRHAADTTREFALPAVVAAANATSSLVDGEEVTVDGTRGMVTRS